MIPHSLPHGTARLLACFLGVLMLSTSCPTGFAATAALLELAYTVPLPGVRGRIDHFALDKEDGRLFVAALGNDSVEVIDLQARKRSGRITGLREPQGIGYVPESKRLFVANAGGGVDVFEGWPLGRVARIDGLDDADNVRYDVRAARIYVGYASALGLVDAKARDLAGSIELAGHPESFQLESPGSRVFVNVPTAKQIAIVDRDRRTVIGTWPIGDASANFPMALDQADHRLLVATRHPASLLVYDTESGARVASLRIGGDADDLFYDAKRKQIYVICGDGVVDVFRQHDADHYAPAGRIRTAAGARTGLLADDVLYVAVPAGGASHAEIRAYSLK